MYKYYADQKTWDEAQRVCQGQQGGSLAIIWSEKTSIIVREMMVEGWIGGNDKSSEGSWRTPTGSGLPWTKWMRNEPNNQGDEDCLFQHGNREMNDLRCDSRKTFICQIKL